MVPALQTQAVVLPLRERLGIPAGGPRIVARIDPGHRAWVD